MGSKTDLRKVKGRVDVVPLENDREWRFYWHAFLGDTRVNGGVCHDLTDGHQHARRAIAIARAEMLRKDHYWDEETFRWIRKGEYPPVS